MNERKAKELVGRLGGHEDAGTVYALAVVLAMNLTDADTAEPVRPADPVLDYSGFTPASLVDTKAYAKGHADGADAVLRRYKLAEYGDGGVPVRTRKYTETAPDGTTYTIYKNEEVAA
jgi:hypothetical protein